MFDTLRVAVPLTAEAFARQAMGDRLDKVGVPKLQHVARVAAAAGPEGSLASEVGWLHDVLEDTPVTVAELARAFPPEVVYPVVILTRQPDETYFQYIERIRISRNAAALTVKRADLTDNLRPSCPASLQHRYHVALTMLAEASDDGV